MGRFDARHVLYIAVPRRAPVMKGSAAPLALTAALALAPPALANELAAPAAPVEAPEAPILPSETPPAAVPTSVPLGWRLPHARSWRVRREVAFLAAVGLPALAIGNIAFRQADMAHQARMPVATAGWASLGGASAVVFFGGGISFLHHWVLSHRADRFDVVPTSADLRRARAWAIVGSAGVGLIGAGLVAFEYDAGRAPLGVQGTPLSLAQALVSVGQLGFSVSSTGLLLDVVPRPDSHRWSCRIGGAVARVAGCTDD